MCAHKHTTNTLDLPYRECYTCTQTSEVWEQQRRSMNPSADPADPVSISTDARRIVEATLDDLRRSRIVERIWQKDHTVWKPDPI